MNHLCKDTRMASGANCADACLFKTHQKSQSKGNLSLTSSKFIYIYTLCLSCVTDFYAWLCLIISQGQCQKSTNCTWLFKRLQLPGMLLKASAFLSRFVLLQLILFLILFQFVQCLKLWYIVIVSNCVLFFLCISMSCQNFKNRSRCMKVQAGLVQDQGLEAIMNLCHI